MQQQEMTTFLWFDNKSEEAAKYCVLIFKNSKINAVHKFPGGAGEPDDSTTLVDFAYNGKQ